MASLKETVGAAFIDVEGSPVYVSEMQRLFHLGVAQDALRTIDDKLKEMRAIQRQRVKLLKYIASLERIESPAANPAVVTQGLDRGADA